MIKRCTKPKLSAGTSKVRREFLKNKYAYYAPSAHKPQFRRTANGNPTLLSGRKGLSLISFPLGRDNPEGDSRLYGPALF